eukprot:CAMPEP_0168464442 /NCGR_PEP_ID=MMETSP0228-20121227/55581_1 /TAXON_ID=133427 /ORGANISM="Protoceratium reticulatum, Strain CCCM 535 (=CCMP 1889)" /LENGTH=161 /DNA_ID=CAMNT_0008479945 /DNA_START=20 /DNA_END=503 /DNA_ORIENTATION=-
MRPSCAARLAGGKLAALMAEDVLLAAGAHPTGRSFARIAMAVVTILERVFAARALLQLDAHVPKAARVPPAGHVRVPCGVEKDRHAPHCRGHWSRISCADVSEHVAEQVGVAVDEEHAVLVPVCGDVAIEEPAEERAALPQRLLAQGEDAPADVELQHHRW